jgi:precorrin-3B synthase
VDDDLNTASVDTAMQTRAPAVSGCPSLLRIVEALDGGICRIKLAGGRLSAAQALVIAAAAELYGSGAI